MGCRSAKGIFCLNRTSRIERTGVLRWGAVVSSGGFVRGVTTLGGGGNGSGVDATGGGTTLGGSIADVHGGGDGMCGGFSGFDLSNIIGVVSLRISGIEWRSQLLKILCRLVIAVGCSW